MAWAFTALLQYPRPTGLHRVRLVAPRRPGMDRGRRLRNERRDQSNADLTPSRPTRRWMVARVQPQTVCSGAGDRATPRNVGRDRGRRIAVSRSERQRSRGRRDGQRRTTRPANEQDRRHAAAANAKRHDENCDPRPTCKSRSPNMRPTPRSRSGSTSSSRNDGLGRSDLSGRLVARTTLNERSRQISRVPANAGIRRRRPTRSRSFKRSYRARILFEQSRDLSGDKGALLLISGVTGKSRVIQTTYGLASRQPMAVTFDYKDSRIRPDQQFVRNLITFDALADAKEAFLPMPNGLVEYVLADASGRSNGPRLPTSSPTRPNPTGIRKS